MAAASRTQLIDQVRALPAGPGVYIFRDAGGGVAYVGKAASLRNRVRSYFGSPHSLEPKTRRLGGGTAGMEYVVTARRPEARVPARPPPPPGPPHPALHRPWRPLRLQTRVPRARPRVDPHPGGEQRGGHPRAP